MAVKTRNPLYEQMYFPAYFSVHLITDFDSLFILTVELRVSQNSNSFLASIVGADSNQFFRIDVVDTSRGIRKAIRKK